MPACGSGAQQNPHLARETPWAQQGRVQYLGPVGSGQQQHARAAFKAIQF